MTESYDSVAAWLASRPESVQKLAKKYPFGSTFEIEGERYYLLGYNESNMLILSKINPRDDYEGANKNKMYVCAEHFEKGCRHEG